MENPKTRGTRRCNAGSFRLWSIAVAKCKKTAGEAPGMPGSAISADMHGILRMALKNGERMADGCRSKILCQ